MSLLGQLYYFDAKLKELPESLTPEAAVNLELCGMEPFEIADLKGLGDAEIRESLRERFASQYNQILSENNLKWATIFWAQLTSALAGTGSLKPPQTDFQQQLTDWAACGYPLLELNDLITAGALTTGLEDFAVYYGLRVLYLLNLRSELEELEDFGITLENPNDVGLELEDSPSVLVVCRQNLAPLFANLNCITLSLTAPEVLEQKINSTLLTAPTIRLVAVVDSQAETIVDNLRKNLDSDIFLSALDIEAKVSANQTFFDRLARKTLGFRL